MEQIAQREKFLEKRREEEHALDEAFNSLAEIEIAREVAKVVDSSSVARKEMAQYRAYLKQLEKERKEEECRLNALLEEHRKEIEKKQDEAKCSLARAKQQLHKVTVKHFTF